MRNFSTVLLVLAIALTVVGVGAWNGGMIGRSTAATPAARTPMDEHGRANGRRAQAADDTVADVSASETGCAGCAGHGISYEELVRRADARDAARDAAAAVPTPSGTGHGAGAHDGLDGPPRAKPVDRRAAAERAAAASRQPTRVPERNVDLLPNGDIAIVQPGVLAGVDFAPGAGRPDTFRIFNRSGGPYSLGFFGQAAGAVLVDGRPVGSGDYVPVVGSVEIELRGPVSMQYRPDAVERPPQSNG